MRIKYAWEKAKKVNVKRLFKKLKKYQRHSSSYVAAWKSSFYCTVCDFVNQQHIDVQKKEMVFSSASCDALVKNTLVFSHLLNVVLVPFLSELTEVMGRLKKKTGHQKLHHHKKVLHAIKECAKDYKMYDSGLGNCKSYCEYFHISTDNYVLEGYPEFFANTLVEIRQYAGAGGSSGETAEEEKKEEEADRRLVQESVEALMKKTKNRIRKLYLKRREGEYYKARLPKKTIFGGLKSLRILDDDFRVPNGKNSNLRILEEAKEGESAQKDEQNPNDWSVDNLDPKANITLKINIFSEYSSDERFDDAMINKMMQVQDIFNTGDPKQHARLIARYYVENFSAEINDIDAPAVFKERTSKRVAFEDYKTVFSFGGIDIHKIVEGINWSLAFDQIGLSLTVANGDDVESIYPDVIKELNTVGNNDVEDFFTNQYMKFSRAKFFMFNETLTETVRDYSMKKIEHVISQKMSVYNYLLQEMKQSEADLIWKEIEKAEEARDVLMNEKADIFVRLSGENNSILEVVNKAGADGMSTVTTIDSKSKSESSVKTSTTKTQPTSEASAEDKKTEENTEEAQKKDASAEKTSQSKTEGTSTRRRKLRSNHRRYSNHQNYSGRSSYVNRRRK